MNYNRRHLRFFILGIYIVSLINYNICVGVS